MTETNRSTRPRRSPSVNGLTLALIAGGLVAVLIVGAAVASALGFRPLDQGAGSASAGSDACPARTTLQVAAAPELEQVLTAAATRAGGKDLCTRYAVEGVPGATVAARLAENAPPDVWVPDSTVWLDGLPADQAAGWTANTTTVARSPILLAIPTAGKYAGEPTPASWGSLLNETGAVKMVDPDHEAAGRLVFDAARSTIPGTLGLSVAERLIFMSRFSGASNAELLAAVPTGTDLEPFPVPEQALAAWAGTHPGALKAVVPAAGTPALDYPWLVRPGVAAAKKAAADALLAAVRDPSGRATLAKAGFRAPDDTGGPTIDAVPPPPYTPVALRGPADRKASLEQWDVLRKDMRMLAVIDVSGSMAWPAIGGGGASRAQVTEDACVTALGIIPAGSKIGGWMFSTGLDGPAKAWKELAPVTRLDEPEGAATHRQVLIETVHTMKSRLQGDTALYDTSLAALEQMTATYEPEYVNSVVLMTDGVNDNPAGGLTLDQLLTEIKKTYNPKRPVRIITIGMGEADSTALQAISAATGGTSYIANTADDIKRVFVEALLARRADVINPAP